MCKDQYICLREKSRIHNVKKEKVFYTHHSNHDIFNTFLEIGTIGTHLSPPKFVKPLQKCV